LNGFFEWQICLGSDPAGLLGGAGLDKRLGYQNGILDWATRILSFATGLGLPWLETVIIASGRPRVDHRQNVSL